MEFKVEWYLAKQHRLIVNSWFKSVVVELYAFLQVVMTDIVSLLRSSSLIFSRITAAAVKASMYVLNLIISRRR